MQKEFITVKELYRSKDEYVGKNVSVAGWIRTSRSSKNFGFIELNDGSFFKNMQVVIAEDKVENFKELSKLPISSSILVEGELVATEGAKQPVEIHATKVTIEGESDSSYPLQKK
ncbi:MAG: OB-fold nucleic acid binding domain-containing protein, partial [Cetobacterium sp.]